MKPKRITLAIALLLFISLCFIFFPSNTNAVYPDDEITVSIDLYDGWNLISIPLMLNVTATGDVFSDIPEPWIAQWFDPLAAPGEQWKIYATFMPPPLRTLQNVNWSMGLWVDSPVNMTLNFTGTGVTESMYWYNIEGKPFNYIGFPYNIYPYGFTAGDLLANTPAYDLWSGYQADGIIYYRVDNNTELEIGKGYWVNTTINYTWNGPWLWIAPPQSQNTKPNLNFEYDKLDMRKERTRVSFNYTGNLQAIREYRWNFGDGTGTKGIEESAPIHTYSFIGNYTVTLEVFTQEGKIYNQTQLIVLQSDFIELDLDNGNLILGDLTYWIPVLAVTGIIGMVIALADPRWLQNRKYWDSEVQGIVSALAFLVGMFFLAIQKGILPI